MGVDSRTIAVNCLGFGQLNVLNTNLFLMRHFQIVTDHIATPLGVPARACVCVCVCFRLCFLMEMFGIPSQSIVLCGRESRPAWRS